MSTTPIATKGRGVFLAVTLACAFGSTATGCSNSSSTTSPPPSLTSTTGAGSAKQAQLALAIGCLRDHGMAIATGSTVKEIRETFEGLPLVQQLSVFAACATLLPAKAREKIRAFISVEQSAASTTTPAA